MNEIEERIKRMEMIRKRNEEIRKANEKKLNHVLSQIENSKYKQRWERLNRQEFRSFWIWTFKLKKDIEKMGSNAPAYQGIWLGYDSQTEKVTLLLDWRKGYVKAQKERTSWMPDGKVKTFSLKEIELLDKDKRLTIVKLGGA